MCVPADAGSGSDGMWWTVGRSRSRLTTTRRRIICTCESRPTILKEGLHKPGRTMLVANRAGCDDSLHEASRSRTESVHQAHAQARVSRRDGARRAVGRADRGDRAARAEGKRGRPPFALETMLRIHFLQQWFALTDPAMEEALHDCPLLRASRSWTAGAADARREHHPAVSPPAGETRLARADAGRGQRAPGASRACCSSPAPSSTPPSSPRPVRPRTRAASATPRCTRPRRATSGTSA